MNKRAIKLFFLLLLLLFAFSWSTIVFYEWGDDYGTHYFYSTLTNKGSILYQDIFSHKGPGYIFFLNFLSKIYGEGINQSYLSLSITNALFLIVCYFIFNKRNNQKKIFSEIIFLLFLLSIYISQSTHSYLTFFQMSFLFLSFYFLLETLEKNDNSNFYKSIFLLFFAVFVRIDSLIYLPLFLLVLLKKNIKKKNSYILFFKDISYSLILITVIFFFFKELFGYTTLDFFISNFQFHLWYKETFFSYTFFGFFGRLVSEKYWTFFIFPALFAAFIFGSKKIKITFEINKFNIGILIVIISFIFWLISASGRTHHTLIATAPLYFFVIYWYKHVTIKNNLLVFFLIILLPITISLSIKNIIKNSVYDCFNNYYCEYSHYKKFEEDIKDFKNYDKLNIIGGNRGFVYLMSNTTPNLVINNYWFYGFENNFVTKKLIEHHDKLIKEKGLVWISKELYNRSKIKRTNPYLNEIIDKSIFIKDQKNYIKLLIE